jgi:hypothetical protein
MRLTEAHFPAQADDPVWETTVGGLLQKITAKYPSQEALVEVKLNGELGKFMTH